jgi:hypothetical protein
MKKNLLLVAAFTLTAIGAHAQTSTQVIGEFPTMDGGMEGQIATTTASSTRTSTTWSVSSTNSSDVRTIGDDGAIARSGTFYVELQMSNTANNNRWNSPTLGAGAIPFDTEYTVQFFYNAAADLGADLTGGTYINGTASGSGQSTAVTSTFVPNQWVKAFATRNSARTDQTTALGQTFGAIRVVNDGGSTSNPVNGPGTTLTKYDDFVVYAGPLDDTAPDAPTATGTSADYSYAGGSATLTWVAPSTGVDGGGYVVVSYATVPNADNDLNQNGIYAVGNTTTNGTGSLVGTVRYIGTAATATFPAPIDQVYKVYAVDKAFNYSTEVVINPANLSTSQNEIVNLKVYPNPATDILNITTDSSDVKTVTIANLAGQVVLSEKTNGTLNISSLSTGLYIATIVENNKTSVVKLSVQ